MRQQHELVQGSPEWAQFRLEHFGASEAAAMLGISPHVKRNELLRMKHTGDAKEYSDWVQKNIFDKGHAVEAAARPMAEAIIGDDLYPATYSEGKLSVSCDGLTMDGSTAFEHKQFNKELYDAVSGGILPDEHTPQCQQALMVTGAKRLLFMVSDGTPDNCAHMWVYPDPDWRKRILQGWAQFSEDLTNYQHVETALEPVAAPITALPALVVQVEGKVLTSNIGAFEQKALAFIDSIKTDISTDQDFVDADKAGKFLKEGEDKLDLVKQQALAQTSSIEELFNAIDRIKEEMRAKRLTLERLVKQRKDTIRAEIENSGKFALAQHIQKLNERLGRAYMPPVVPADFAGVMRGKKTITSLRDAVDTELARAKIVANEVADKISINLNSLRATQKDHPFLFEDTPQLVLKDNDAVVAIIKSRIAEHDEAARRKREAAAAAAPPPVAPAPVVPPPAPTVPDITPIANKATETSIIDAYLKTLDETPKKKAEIKKHIVAFFAWRSDKTKAA